MDVLSLIKKACKNNRDAQDMLYKAYNVGWYTTCLRYNNNRSDAQDVLQNALIKIFSKLDQFEPDKGSFKAWSSRIVVNENLMFIRKKINAFRIDTLENAFAIEDKVEDAVDKLSAKELVAMIQSLPVGYRTVFNLYVMEGYNHQEIAEKLDITPGTSKSQLFKAKAMLKQKLEFQLNVEAYVWK